MSKTIYPSKFKIWDNQKRGMKTIHCRLSSGYLKKLKDIKKELNKKTYRQIYIGSKKMLDNNLIIPIMTETSLTNDDVFSFIIRTRRIFDKQYSRFMISKIKKRNINTRTTNKNEEIKPFNSKGILKKKYDKIYDLPHIIFIEDSINWIEINLDSILKGKKEFESVIDLYSQKEFERLFRKTIQYKFKDHYSKTNKEIEKIHKLKTNHKFKTIDEKIVYLDKLTKKYNKLSFKNLKKAKTNSFKV